MLKRLALTLLFLCAVPLLSAAAQSSSEGPGPVTCSTAPTLVPDHGPPGTEVTVTATFTGNCSDFDPTTTGSECEGVVTGDIETIVFPFSFAPAKAGAIGTGTFTAPVTEPSPPVVDAIEVLTVTITCSVTDPDISDVFTDDITSEAVEGSQGGTTTYVYPDAFFDLELFAANDGDQPTLVDNDQDEVDDNDDVVEAAPPFTG